VRTLQLYATGAATATSVAQVTVPVATRIRGVILSFLIDSITDNAIVRIELSKVPTNQTAVNGAFDPFLEVGKFGNFVTSGLAQTGDNIFIPLDVDCRAGEVIYLHATVSGTATYYVNAIFNY
jgi:hypothetical protein